MAIKKTHATGFLYGVISGLVYNKGTNQVNYQFEVYDTTPAEFAEYTNRFSFAENLKTKLAYLADNPNLSMQDVEAYKTLTGEIADLNRIVLEYCNPESLLKNKVSVTPRTLDLGYNSFSEVDALNLAYLAIKTYPLYSEWEDC